MSERHDPEPRQPEPETDLLPTAAAGAGADDDGLPHENPNRPREYHGRRTMLAAFGVAGAVALALVLALRGGGSPSADGAFGVTAIPRYMNPTGAEVAVEVGALAPDFELETLDGGRFRLSDYRGHPVVVNFWASWCEPCRREVPVLIRLQEEYREMGLVIAGVNIEEARGPARGFVDEFGIDYLLPMDFSGDVVRKYEVFGPPHTYFIDPEGRIDTIFRGQAPDHRFESTMAAFVAAVADPPGAEMAPGLKALPVTLSDDAEPALETGAPAPDFLLREGEATWRLSAQRGARVLLAFVGPGCDATCRAAVAGVVSDASADGVGAITIGTDANYPSPADVSALYRGGHKARFLVVGPDGVIKLITGDAVEAVAALRRPPGEA